MSNSAVVTVQDSKVGVYLKCNGGRESIEAFLRAAKELGVRDPVSDTSYFYARFTQIVGNFFGGTVFVGVDSLTKLDTTTDNGVYVIGTDFKILNGVAANPRLSADYSEEVYKLVMETNETHFHNKY